MHLSNTKNQFQINLNIKGINIFRCHETVKCGEQSIDQISNVHRRQGTKTFGKVAAFLFSILTMNLEDKYLNHNIAQIPEHGVCEVCIHVMESLFETTCFTILFLWVAGAQRSRLWLWPFSWQAPLFPWH